MKIFSIETLAAALAFGLTASAASATCVSNCTPPEPPTGVPLTVTGWTGTGTVFTGNGGTLDGDGNIVPSPDIVVDFNDAWADSDEDANITVDMTGLCGDTPCAEGGDPFEFSLNATAEGGTGNLFYNSQSGVPLVATGAGSLGSSVGLTVDEGDTRTTAMLGIVGGYVGVTTAEGVGDTVESGASTNGSGVMTVNMNSGDEPLCPSLTCSDIVAAGHGELSSSTASWVTASGGTSPVVAATSGSNLLTVQVNRDFTTGPIPAPAPGPAD